MPPSTAAERATVRRQISAYADDDRDIEWELVNMLDVML
jgi:hypothetical protein